MTNSYIAYGSWKIRNGEPLLEADKTIYLCPLPGRLNQSDWSIIEDFSLFELHPVYRVNGDGGLHGATNTDRVRLGNLDPDFIPLAIVSLLIDQFVITHRLTRLDSSLAHLIRMAADDALNKNLVTGLWDSFDRDHLYLNNWECLYFKGLPDIELEQKFEIDQNYDYYSICQKWWARLDNRQVQGFIPQLGDEIQYWSYDNHFYEIDSDSSEDRGYVSIMQYCKRKNQWDDPMFTYKKKVYDGDQLERWERNYENQWLDTDPKTGLSNFFGYKLKELPQWRRTRFDLACEAIDTGNIFMVNFEDCRVHGAAPGTGRLQQCEVEYLKTRGKPNPDVIYADFERLLQEVEKFMTELSLTYRRCHYSKLTFLQDYVAAHRTLALSEVTSQ